MGLLKKLRKRHPPAAATAPAAAHPATEQLLEQLEALRAEQARTNAVLQQHLPALSSGMQQVCAAATAGSRHLEALEGKADAGLRALHRIEGWLAALAAQLMAGGCWGACSTVLLVGARVMWATLAALAARKASRHVWGACLRRAAAPVRPWLLQVLTLRAAPAAARCSPLAAGCGALAVVLLLACQVTAAPPRPRAAGSGDGRCGGAGVVAAAGQWAVLHGAAGWLCVWLAGGHCWLWLLCWNAWVWWVVVGWWPLSASAPPPPPPAPPHSAGRAPHVEWLARLAGVGSGVGAAFLAPACVAAGAFAPAANLAALAVAAAAVAVRLLLRAAAGGVPCAACG